MKQVLVIGASRGLGLEFVRQYAADGARVVATARDASGLDRLRAAGAAQGLELDVADAASVSGLAQAIAGASFDVAIYNAGVYGPRLSAPEAPAEADFDAVMHINVLGAMRVLPQLAGAFAPGARLAVISSRMGSIGLRGNGTGWLYRASKAALNSVLKDLSFVYAGQAICAAFHPGWVKTDMGGVDADLEVGDSVAALRRSIAALSAQHHGGFFDHDGAPLAW
jgi:NAD(P)-dependent dehydrogenase (short-subunit alcohol dehydrogenase family)